MRQKFLVILLIIGVILFAGSAWPDFGSFSGNSDYGGSSSSSSSSGGSYSSPSDGGSYSRPQRSTRSITNNSPSFNFNPTPLAGGVATGALLDDDDGSISTIIGIIAVIFILYMAWRSTRKKKDTRPIIPINVEPAQNLRPIDEYLKLDPKFDETEIQALMSNLYVQMQNTWQAKDISSLRPYMTDAFYSQMDRQLDTLRLTHKTDYTENISVLGVRLKGFRQFGGMDYIVVGLTSRIISYILDDRTGKLVSGDQKREKFMEYEIELSRKSGVVTQEKKGGAISKTCPHCGAPINLNASARCEYCGSIITDINTDWAVCNMKGISQRTA